MLLLCLADSVRGFQGVGKDFLIGAVVFFVGIESLLHDSVFDNFATVRYDVVVVVVVVDDVFVDIGCLLVPLLPE